MAETTDRPTTVTAAPLPAAELPRDEPYRPISLLAVLGFSLAALYAFLVLLGGLTPVATNNPRLFIFLVVSAPLVGAQVALLRKDRSLSRVATSAGAGLLALAVVLGIGGLMAYSGSNPWLLLSDLGWLLVGAAVVFCWLARSRIAASENTLGGASLASWGLSVALFAGLIYAAYLTSNTFAVRAQARAISEEFLHLIADKKDPESLRKAFLLMLPVNARPSTDIRRSIEIQHNLMQDPNGRMGGPFTQFRTSQYVQMLRAGADKISYERAGMTTYERGGYQVGLIYRIEGPLGSILVQVGTQGSDVAEGGSSSRRWNVMGPQGEMGTKLVEYHPSSWAKGLESGAQLASKLANEWVDRSKRGDVATAYLLTLPEAERKLQAGAASMANAPALAVVTGVALPGALGGNQEGTEAFTKGMAEYRTAKLLDLQQHDFFSAVPEKANAPSPRDQMISDVKWIYKGEGQQEVDIRLTNQPPAFDELAENRYVFPVQFVTRTRGKEAPFFIDGEIEVLGTPEKGRLIDLRVGKVRLIRGQLQPSESRQRPGEG